MDNSGWARRLAGTVAACAVAGGVLALAPTSAGAQLPDCAHAPVRLSPLYAHNVPGSASPEGAAAHLVASLDSTVDLGSGVLGHVVAEAREGSAVVTSSDGSALRAVAMTTRHPAGGWIVDQLWTCTSAVAR